MSKFIFMFPYSEKYHVLKNHQFLEQWIEDAKDLDHPLYFYDTYTLGKSVVQRLKKTCDLILFHAKHQSCVSIVDGHYICAPGFDNSLAMQLMPTTGYYSKYLNALQDISILMGVLLDNWPDYTKYCHFELRHA